MLKHARQGWFAHGHLVTRRAAWPRPGRRRRLRRPPFAPLLYRHANLPRREVSCGRKPWPLRTNAPRIIHAAAPIRICDNGGWTDTWFARYGRVFNIGVYPYAEVQMRVSAHAGERARITINAENYGERYDDRRTAGPCYDKHPLLEAAIDYMHVPTDLSPSRSPSTREAPSGCFDRHLGRGQRRADRRAGLPHARPPDRPRGRLRRPDDRDRAAQAAVRHPGPDLLGLRRHQLHRDVRVPARHRQPHPACPTPSGGSWSAGWSLIFLGKSHSSSEVHEMVIRELEDAGPDAAKLGRPARRPPRARATRSTPAISPPWAGP